MPPPRKRTRLDVALVERGLEASRERAQRLIVAGEVTVDGQPARAPSMLVAADAVLAIGKPLPYVSRGGLKLAHALDRFGIDVLNRVCLDAGASAGGFTDCLLQRGAARVYAADVGKGQLAWSLRQDPRVVVMEGVNVRYLRPATPTLGQTDDTAPRLPEAVSLATADLAFISLRLVFPAIARVLTADGEVVALVKPQFEAGPADVGKGGVVRKPAVHRRVLHEVLDAARAAGLTPTGLTASPIRGQAGNAEFFLWTRSEATVPAGQAAPDGRRTALAAFDEPAAIDAALAEV
jgi:23S rRNA (cytidine1920-2'-O)/16S rRNA (cytidine1409-2'-O)-methyltransferase